MIWIAAVIMSLLCIACYFHKYSLALIRLVAISFTKKNRRSFLVSSILSLALGHANRIPGPIDLYIRCLTLLPCRIWMVPPMMIPPAYAFWKMLISCCIAWVGLRVVEITETVLPGDPLELKLVTYTLPLLGSDAGLNTYIFKPYQTLISAIIWAKGFENVFCNSGNICNTGICLYCLLLYKHG